jgi:hypothetical protein
MIWHPLCRLNGLRFHRDILGFRASRSTPANDERRNHEYLAFPMVRNCWFSLDLDDPGMKWAIIPSMKDRNKVLIQIPLDPVIEAYKKDVDRTLIRENLRLSVQERFENLMRLQEFADELHRAGSTKKYGRKSS